MNQRNVRCAARAALGLGLLALTVAVALMARIVAVPGNELKAIPMAVIALLNYPWLVVEIVELRLLRALSSEQPRR
jgi:hypothetical protein